MRLQGIEACEDRKSQAPLYGNRSHAYRLLKKYPEALEDANRTIEVAPEYHRGYTRKIFTLKRMGRFEDCKQAVEEAFASGVDFGEKMKDQLDSILADMTRRVEQTKKLADVVEKLAGGPNRGVWHGQSPEEFGGGSQELQFKSATQVLLVMPGARVLAKLHLDVMKEPMELDIILDNFPQPIPHIFRFTEDGKALELMGPQQGQMVARRPTEFNSKLESYVKLVPGNAPESNDEVEIKSEITRLKSTGADEKEIMMRYCEMMSKPLSAAAAKGFRFEEMQPSWPDEKKKLFIKSSVQISQYLYLLEKHFEAHRSRAVFAMVGGRATAPSGPLRAAVEKLKKSMDAVGMENPQKWEARQRAAQAAKSQEQKTLPATSAGSDAPKTTTPAETSTSAAQAPKPTTRTKKVGKSGSPSLLGSTSTSTWVLLGAVATAMIGLAAYAFSGRNKKR